MSRGLGEVYKRQLHVDPETGVKGRFWTEPIEVTFDNWEYTPRQW